MCLVLTSFSLCACSSLFPGLLLAFPLAPWLPSGPLASACRPFPSLLPRALSSRRPFCFLCLTSLLSFRPPCIASAPLPLPASALPLPPLFSLPACPSLQAGGFGRGLLLQTILLEPFCPPRNPPSSFSPLPPAPIPPCRRADGPCYHCPGRRPALCSHMPHSRAFECFCNALGKPTSRNRTHGGLMARSLS